MLLVGKSRIGAISFGLAGLIDIQMHCDHLPFKAQALIAVQQAL
jgi:hypothetical protein